MNISKTENSDSLNANFKAKLIVDAKLAKRLPGIENFREIAESVKSADFIRIRRSVNTRYLPNHDMYVVIAEKNATIKPDKNSSKQNKHFFGLGSKLLHKNTPREDVQIEILDLMNDSLDNLSKKIAKYNEEFPGAIVEDKTLFQKIKSFLKR